MRIPLFTAEIVLINTRASAALFLYLSHYYTIVSFCILCHVHVLRSLCFTYHCDQAFRLLCHATTFTLSTLVNTFTELYTVGTIYGQNSFAKAFKNLARYRVENNFVKSSK